MLTFIWISFKPILEIIILWIAFYRILVFFEGTRAFQVLKGLVYLLAAFLLSLVLELQTINWLLTNFFAIWIIAVLIIFQPELRQGLARLGQQNPFAKALKETAILAVIDQLASAIFKLAGKKVGCLIAIERENKLLPYIESGVAIDSTVTEELLQSIFMPLSPMHDGGVILKGDRVAAASCLFPLSENPSFSKIIGTRHRATLGLSEQTDAIVLMSSEENGEIAVAVDGKFMQIANQERLVELLKSLLIVAPQKKK